MRNKEVDIQNTEMKNYITSKELLDKLNSMYPFVKFTYGTGILRGIIGRKKDEYKNSNKIILNGYKKMHLYSNEFVNEVIWDLENHMNDSKVRLLNMTFEEYKSLSESDIKRDYYCLNDVIKVFNKNNIRIHNEIKFRFFRNRFKNTNIKVIFILKGESFVSKKELDICLNEIKVYISGKDIKDKYNVNMTAKIAEVNKLEYKTNLPVLGEGIFVKEYGITEYVKRNHHLKERRNTKSLLGDFNAKIKYYPNKNEEKYPISMKIFLNFILEVSNNVLKKYTSIYFNIYNLLFDNLNKEISAMTQEEWKILYQNILLGLENTKKNIFIEFINYLRNNGVNAPAIANTTTLKELEPYSAEQFINLVVGILDIIKDNESLKKTYRNWNLSTALTYVFMHFCVAWRRTDIIDKLPQINLKLIDGVSDGESFFKWLENGGEITDEIARIVCKYMEERVDRLGLKINKTTKQITCILPEVMYKEIALLLFISEANRQIHTIKYKRARKKNTILNPDYTQPKKITELFLENFNLNLTEILGGKFENIRMNKGFLSLVRDKAEELGLAWGYYAAQKLRGHSVSKRTLLSDMTKIYLRKEIDDISLKAFSIGSMGSVVYNILKIMNFDFNNKTVSEQIELVRAFKLTPFEIEKATEIIQKKAFEMERVINKFLSEGGNKDNFMSELLYGKDSFGLERQTKCLLKVIKNATNKIEKISLVVDKPCWIGKKSCIGCDYLIALRYFIYEFERKFNELLDKLEESETYLDREIHIARFNNIYLPVIEDIYSALGEQVLEFLDMDRFYRLVESDD